MVNRFVTGQCVADRFRIVRFIARGAMGEVYEALDLELGEHVALKTLPRDHADSDATSRLKREVHMARRITSPHVCRTFDVFHHAPGSLADDVLFVTMELLEGETLADALKRRGRLTPDEALATGVQIALGLDAAHRAGVLHGDFKSSNIILVPDGSTPWRAVVTDFGLARRMGGEKTTLTMLGDGPFAGTPAYMAPEIVEGQTAGPAADVYSLGVVLFELTTGRLPFVADTPIATALLRIRQPPPSPRDFVPDLDEHWTQVIERCLARHTGDRLGSAAEVAAALQGPRLAAVRRSRMPVVAVVAVSAVIIGGAVAASLWSARRHVPAATVNAPRTGTRQAVAILGFQNVSGVADAAWVSVALTQALGTELAATSKLRSVSGEAVSRAKAELSINDAETLALDTLAKLRRNLGADMVVLGSFVVLPGAPRMLRFDVRVQDTSTGESVAAVSEAGTEAQLFELLDRSGAALRRALGLENRSTEQAVALRWSLPASLKASELYLSRVTQPPALRRARGSTAPDTSHQTGARLPAWTCGASDCLEPARRRRTGHSHGGPGNRAVERPATARTVVA